MMTEQKLMYKKRISSTQVEEIWDIYNSHDTVECLEDCLEQGFAPWFMPRLIKERIDKSADDPIWTQGYVAPSLFATRETDKGTIALIAHVENYFCHPKNHYKSEFLYQSIIKQEKTAGKRLYWLRNQHMGTYPPVLPKQEFMRLLELKDDKNVFVNDFLKLSDFNYTNEGDNEWAFNTHHWLSLEDAKRYPLTVPFLGGEEQAEKYLPKHGEIIGKWVKIKGSSLSFLYMGFRDEYELTCEHGVSHGARFRGSRIVNERPE